MPLGIAPPLVVCACFGIKRPNMPGVRTSVFHSTCIKLFVAFNETFGQNCGDSEYTRLGGWWILLLATLKVLQ